MRIRSLAFGLICLLVAFAAAGPAAAGPASRPAPDLVVAARVDGHGDGWARFRVRVRNVGDARTVRWAHVALGAQLPPRATLVGPTNAALMPAIGPYRLALWPRRIADRLDPGGPAAVLTLTVRFPHGSTPRAVFFAGPMGPGGNYAPDPTPLNNQAAARA